MQTDSDSDAGGFGSSPQRAADLDLTLLFFRDLEGQGGADLADPLRRYLELTAERRQILVRCPDLAAAVGRMATDHPDLAVRLGLI